MKITKAFLDAVYAFLDGLVLLASDSDTEGVSAPSVGGGGVPAAATAEVLPGANNGAVAGVVGSRVELIDLSKPVSCTLFSSDFFHSFSPFWR